MWTISNNLIGSRKALQHSITKEFCIFGQFGEIFPSSKTTLKAIVKGNLKGKVAAYLGLPDNVGTRECELIVSFTSDKLEDMIRMLKVPKTVTTQMEIANEKST